MKRLTILFLLMVVDAVAQFGRTTYWASSYTGLMVVPTSSTAIPNAGNSVELDIGFCVNTTASSATLTITDGTTACNGAACQPWPAVPLPANSTYSIDFRGLIVTGGANWQASAANSIQCYIRGRK